MKKTALLLLIALLSVSTGWSQAPKKPLDFTLYDSWKSLGSPRISDKGDWLIWNINPTAGDGTLYISRWDAPAPEWSIPRASQAQLDPESRFVAFRIQPQADTVRKGKIEKLKTEKMPKDSLGILTLSDGKLKKLPQLKSFQVADEGSTLLAYQLEETKAEVKPEKKDSTAATKKPEDKSKKKPEFNGVPLYVVNPASGDSQQFAKVTEYGFTKKGNWLYSVSIDEDSVKTSTVRILDTKSGQIKEVFSQTGVVKSVTADEEGTQLAFLFTTDTAKNKVYNLYHWNGKDQPRCIVETSTPGMTEGWSVAESGRLSFSPNGQRLFFSAGKKPENKKEEKDTLLADDKVSVDIWHWSEDVLQSIQLKQADQQNRRNWQAVYNLKKGNMIQLGNPDFIENYRLIQQGDVDWAIGNFDKPYRLDNSITSGSLKDIYFLDLNTGNKSEMFKKVEFNTSASPYGNYLVWWQPQDSCWYAYGVQSKTTVNLTKGLPVPFVNQIHDTPDEPGSYGVMGWSEKDSYIFLYDQFDIWRIDPDAKEAAVCVTGSYGRKNQITLRYQSLDPDEKFVSLDKEYLFSGINQKNKQSGFYRFTLKKGEPIRVMMDDCRYAGVSKAKKADKLIWTRSTVSEYPDLWTGDLRFSGARKVTQANPQQKDYLWADVELIEWPDLNGEVHQGLLYKPENMQAGKKYPMIVYFYERHSDGLHQHYTPRASASTVNPLEYASNGYLVFMPDIHFIIGNPGKSFYNAIMSGIMFINNKGFLDMEHLGIQGQSWGGYGTAFMITQTDIFAAASPGAPVSNMTSAYGGIRTESGMVRQFQYEKTQSRIGGTLWQKPEYYIENSPLFYADRINTPCLIRHDDADGAVPFSEGVQLFVALRRLGKPAWLVNYNGQPHNLSRQADKKDWSVRMMQFFDHYLKGAPAPTWMTVGVPAVDKKKSELYYWPYTEK